MCQLNVKRYRDMYMYVWCGHILWVCYVLYICTLPLMACWGVLLFGSPILIVWPRRDLHVHVYVKDHLCTCIVPSHRAVFMQKKLLNIGVNKSEIIISMHVYTCTVHAILTYVCTVHVHVHIVYVKSILCIYVTSMYYIYMYMYMYMYVCMYIYTCMYSLHIPLSVNLSVCLSQSTHSPFLGVRMMVRGVP